MKFCDDFPVGTEVSIVKRNRFFKDSTWGGDYVVIAPVDGVTDDRYVWVRDGHHHLFADGATGAVLGYPRTFITLADQEELRDNIFCRIFDFFILMMAGDIDAEQDNRGSCV